MITIPIPAFSMVSVGLIKAVLVILDQLGLFVKFLPQEMENATIISIKLSTALMEVIAALTHVRAPENINVVEIPQEITMSASINVSIIVKSKKLATSPDHQVFEGISSKSDLQIRILEMYQKSV